MKKLFVALTIFSCCLVSCRKVQDFTYGHRTPHKVAFQERVLPAGFVIGSNRPSEAAAVDLGLSVKWSNMSVTASKQANAAAYFAWAEMRPSKKYDWVNYEYNDHRESDPNCLYLTKYCFDLYGENQDVEAGSVLNKFDDAAYLNWGEKWRMPTTAELKELAQNCTFEECETKDAAGKVTERYLTCTSSKNGNTIRINLPLTGDVTEIDYDGMGVEGLWSNALSSATSVEAVCLNLTDFKKPVVTTDQRPFGYAIQAVYAE